MKRHARPVAVPVKLQNRLRLLREARGLSQAELGAKVGRSQQQIDRLEEPGYGLRAGQVTALAAALDVHPFALLLPEHLWPDPHGGGGATLDRDLLALVITESERFFELENVALAPAKKAELYLAVHDWMAKQGAADAATARADIAEAHTMMRVLIA
jgi:transcriptional regulator with XRE-family HTH domain